MVTWFKNQDRNDKNELAAIKTQDKQLILNK
jgi:hypothetical protein